MNGSSMAGTKVWVLAGLVAAASLAVAGDSDGRGHDGRGHDDSGDAGRIQRGKEIVPPGVTLNLAGKHRGQVWLGSYLVNTNGCADCHTYPTYSPGGNPFLHQPERINAEQYMSGGRQFGPAITASNLTPDYAGRPAGLTREEFVQTLRTGHNPHDPAGELLQVMPWPAFGQMTTQDLQAMYEYLRSIPALPDNPNPGP
jgi:mono/diheme cytochrome c family protein